MEPSRKDWVDRAVVDIWQEKPGIGIKAMLVEVLNRIKSNGSSPSMNSKKSCTPSSDVLAAVPEPFMVTKARIKHSQAFIPYKYLKNNSIDLAHPQKELIEVRLEERMTFRANRDFLRADQLKGALEAMGVEIDDRLKTWKMVREPPSQTLLEVKQEERDASERQTCNNENLSANHTCKFCSKTFPSRNDIFRHLRDPTSGCGNAIFATGQQIEEPPSVLQERKKEDEIAARRINKKRNARESPRIDAAACLWIGDLPLQWTTPRKRFSDLRSVLYQYLPQDVPTPWIKRVVRKAYRKRADSIYHGYAMVVFRDAEEANIVCKMLDGQEIEPAVVFERHSVTTDQLANYESFRMRVCPAVSTNSGGVAYPDVGGQDHKPIAGREPPLASQLRPLGKEEIIQRTGRLENLIKSIGKDTSPTCLDGGSHDKQHDIDFFLPRLVWLYEKYDFLRLQVKRQGRPIPDELAKCALDILQNLRWPARNERQGLSSERYLVLQSNVSSDRFYGHLREICRKLMNWADPRYTYSGLAITKNFVASPHIDHRDQTFQYALSFGDFGPGGELCVEGTRDDGRCIVNVITTRNRIARVDGRNVHFVREWEGGDRYSMIFYNTHENSYSPLLSSGFDEEFFVDNSNHEIK